MSYVPGTAATGATSGAVAAAIANAIKASGVLVKVENRDFMAILNKGESPLVVRSEGGFISKSYSYLTSYKGLAFYTKSKNELHLPGDAELINSKKLSIPG